MIAPTKPKVLTIPAGEFKAKCLQLMDEVLEKNLTLIVTKRGKPVIHAIAPPPEEKPFVSLWGRSPQVKILGDIVSPLSEEWTLPEFAWENSSSKVKPSKEKRKGKKK